MIKKSTIHRTDGQVYMIRWSFTPFIKVHKFIRSDDSCHHDHPWWFISIRLRGWYYDVTEKQEELGPGFPMTVVTRTIAKRIMFRKALHVHRVELEEEVYETGYPDVWYNSYSPKRYKSCWTLVINGRERREWGFATMTGWVRWVDFFKRDKSKNICK